MLDAPPQLDQEVVACVANAAAHYDLDPQEVVDRILRRKGASGEIRQVEGRTELGIYGVDAASLPRLQGEGLSAQRILEEDCLNVTVGVYISALDRHPAQAARSETTAAVASVRDGSQSRQLPRLDGQADRCVDTAAAAYGLPAHVFRAVLRTEGGWAGLKKRNTNGSYDLGPAQINTIHLPELSKHGITEHMLVHDACINIYVGAYRLKVEIERVGDLWRGVGNYHSRTPHLHQAYLKRVRGNL